MGIRNRQVSLRNTLIEIIILHFVLPRTINCKFTILASVSRTLQKRTIEQTEYFAEVEIPDILSVSVTTNIVSTV